MAQWRPKAGVLERALFVDFVCSTVPRVFCLCVGADSWLEWTSGARELSIKKLFVCAVHVFTCVLVISSVVFSCVLVHQ